MSHADLLLEIGMEECPARFVQPALQDLKKAVRDRLGEARIAAGEMLTYGGPRRLALLVRDVGLRQGDLEQQVKGPPARVAFASDGSPTKAAEGFAANQGVSVDDLAVQETESGAYVFALKREKGKDALEVLPSLLQEALAALRFPKSMVWSDDRFRFARPIRWIACLLGESVVSFSVGGVTSGRATRGHRFLSEGEATLPSAGDYVRVLREEGRVIVDMDERRSAIEGQVKALAEELGFQALIDDALLDEVTQLVEWPNALLGDFDPQYLDLPAQILITTMQAHQRYFPVVDSSGKLQPHFITVRNGDAQGIDRVKRGNEKVLSARLADAKFFFDEDRKKSLELRLDELEGVLFQEKLGTMRQKAERVRRLIRTTASEVDADALEIADRAALLCKADLVTHVVHEFPELQGVMGETYAREQGESDAVATAIFEHYLPRHAQDELPNSLAGTLVSLADKADTIAGCFGIGLIPTGSADPYALRRQALGMIRTMLANRPPVRLDQLVRAAVGEHGSVIENPAETMDEVMRFFGARLRNMLIDRGVRYDIAEAAIADAVGDVARAEARALALSEASGSSEFEAMLVAYQRAANLGSKSRGETTVNAAYFKDEAENALWRAIESVREEVDALAREGRFADAIRVLSGLKQPIDAFFNAVLVMDPDEKIKENRLALLREAAAAFHVVGDLSRVRQDHREDAGLEE